MTDATQDDIRQLTEALNKASGVFGKIPDLIKERESLSRKRAGKHLLDDLEGAARRNTQVIDEATESLELLGANTSQLSRAFQNMMRTGIFGALGGAVIANFTNWIGDLTTTYRDIANVGQTFTNGILEMSTVAGQSGVTLDEFARTLKNHSIVAARLSAKGFMGLAREVRRGTEAFGLYGYTVEALNDFTGEYLESMRIQGRLESIQTADTTKRFQDLAKNTAILSAMFGKSREEINKSTNAAQQEALLTLRVARMTEDEFTRYQNNILPMLQTAATQGGEEFSKFIAQSFGGKSAALTEMGKMLASSGAGDIVALVDKLNEDVFAGRVTQEDAINQIMMAIKEEVKTNDGLAGLIQQGDANAKTFVDWANRAQVAKPGDRERAAASVEGQNEFSNASLALGNQVQGILGDIRSVLVGSLLSLTETGFTQKFFKDLNRGFTDLGKKVTDFVGRYPDVQSMVKALLDSGQDVGGVVGSMITGMGNVLAFLNQSLLPFLTGALWPFLKDTLLPGLTAIGTVVMTAAGAVLQFATGMSTAIANVLEWFGVNGSLATAIGAAATMLTGLAAVKVVPMLIENLTSKMIGTMRVNAAVVNIYGRTINGGGGGGMDLDLPDGDRGGGANGKPKGRIGKWMDRLGGLGRFAKGGGRLLGTAASAAFAGWDLISAYQTDQDLDAQLDRGEISQDEHDEAATRNVTNTAVPFATAGIGAAIGSVVPVLGTAAGAGIGYGVGSVANWLGAGDWLADLINGDDDAATPADPVDPEAERQRAEVMSTLPRLVLPLAELPADLRVEFTDLLDRFAAEQASGGDVADERQELTRMVDNLNDATRSMMGGPTMLEVERQRLQDHYDALERSVTQPGRISQDQREEREAQRKLLEQIGEQLRILTAVQAEAARMQDRRGRETVGAIRDNAPG